MRRERALLIKVNGKERVVGKLLTINGDWCFYREVLKTAHAFRTFNAWSIQASIISVLEADGVKWIYQYDRQAGQMNRISLADFKEKAVERNFGEGKQLYVSTKYFELVPNMGPVKKWINSVELVA